MQRVIIIILAVLVVLPVFLKGRSNGVHPVPAAFSALSSARVQVRIGGDVRHAGIYNVSANSLAPSVMILAVPDNKISRLLPTGATGLPVVNGADIHLKIERDGTGIITVGSIPAGERMVLGIPLDINSMSEADFDRLPGVGAVMARRIIEYRQNNGGKMKVEDLLAVGGISENKYVRICKYF
ncbi:MAG: helix-hairpin-helix domain-containing protein [Deltaproteobacteria bacterium]|nr:helix-hairpin-helix domain-containing protein [Deltaproteobacteria bacterium]